MTIVYLYRVHCIEENLDVTLWSQSVPTLCPNDHADRTIDSSLTVIESSIGDNIVTAQEPTEGYFQATVVDVNVSSGSIGDVTDHDYSWPMDMSMWQLEFLASSANIGDTIDIAIAPDTVIGVLTSAASVSDTVLNISSAVFSTDTIKKGIDVKISDGVNTDLGGRIVGYDPENHTVTLETALTNAYAIGTPVYITIYPVKSYKITQDKAVVNFGKKGFKGKSIPKDTTIRVSYTNSDGSAKTLHMHLEFYHT